MLSDAGINGKWPSTAEMANNIAVPSFFWRFSDGDYNDRTFSDGYAFNWPWYHNDVSWQPEGGDLLTGDKGQRFGCQWYIGAEQNFGKDANGKPVKVEGIQSTGELSMGNRWLVVKAVTPENVPRRAWDTGRPGCPPLKGAKITVSLRMRGKGIISSEKGSPAVFLVFVNETGQHRRRLPRRRRRGRQWRRRSARHTDDAPGADPGLLCLDAREGNHHRPAGRHPHGPVPRCQAVQGRGEFRRY